MGRDRTGPLVLFGLLAACGAVVWLMYHPEWPPLESAARLPGVGPYVARFRERYTPPEPAGRPPVAADRSSSIEIVLEPPREPDAAPRLWVQPGTPVRDAPSPRGTTLGLVEALSNPRWTERSGDWYRIESRGSSRGDGDLAGWVFVGDPEASFATRPPTTEPAGPLAANRINPDILSRARTLMGRDALDGNCGPYGLLTDVRESALEALCAEFVTRVDAAFARRFGLQPLGSAAETLLVFGEERDFKIFAGSTSRWRVEASGRASASEGYAALPWEGRERDAVATTMVHELTHLVNRRALGPALPPWLDEGMADELAEGLVGGKYQAAAWQVDMGRASGDLVPLVEFLDQGASEFYSERGHASYAQALLVLRWLSGHPELEVGFQRFLGSLAGGGSYSPEVLRGYLGRPWDDLQNNWDAWGRRHYSSFPPFTEKLAGSAG